MENELRILTSTMHEPDKFPTMATIKLRWRHRLFLAVAPTVTRHTKEGTMQYVWKYKRTPFGKVLISVLPAIDETLTPKDSHA